MKYIKYIEKNENLGQRKPIATPNVVYLEDGNLLYVKKQIGQVYLVNINGQIIDVNDYDNTIIDSSYKDKYFTILSLEDNNKIYWKCENYENENGSKTISISFNGKTWEEKTSTPEGTLLAKLNTNSKLYIKGSNDAYAISDQTYSYFHTTKDFNVEGNIMSLIHGDQFMIKDGDNVTYNDEFPERGSSYSFYSLFNGCSKLQYARNLILPATTVYPNGYRSLFEGCSSLTVGPNLLASTLNSYCYANMFWGCVNLVVAPQLPATTLAEACYSNMFRGCSKLVAAPVLPAPILVDKCYIYMFALCKSLNYIKCLATDISARGCTNFWLLDISNDITGTFIKAPENVNWPRNNNGIPENWTVLDHNNYFTITSLEDDNHIKWHTSDNSFIKTIFVPNNEGGWNEITPTKDGTLIKESLGKNQTIYIKGENSQYGDGTNYTYFSSTKQFSVSGNIMSLVNGDNFNNSTELSKSYTFYKLFNGCNNLIYSKNLFLPATTLTTHCYDSMFISCSSLVDSPELPARILTESCYQSMFESCDNLVTSPELSSMTLANSCYKRMFWACRSLYNVHKLPATTLQESCYESMFRGCYKLLSAPTLPATTLVSNCYREMFKNCKNLKFVRCLATNIVNGDSSAYTLIWLQGVKNAGVFRKQDTVTWNRGISGIPESWLVAAIDDDIIDPTESPTSPTPDPDITSTPPEETTAAYDPNASTFKLLNIPSNKVLNLHVGDTFTVLSNSDLVYYSSDNKTVLKVTDPWGGVLRAVSGGIAQVTASSDSIIKFIVSVTGSGNDPAAESTPPTSDEPQGDSSTEPTDEGTENPGNNTGHQGGGWQGGIEDDTSAESTPATSNEPQGEPSGEPAVEQGEATTAPESSNEDDPPATTHDDGNNTSQNDPPAEPTGGQDDPNESTPATSNEPQGEPSGEPAVEQGEATTAPESSNEDDPPATTHSDGNNTPQNDPPAETTPTTSDEPEGDSSTEPID